jgi:hypothetical protein
VTTTAASGLHLERTECEERPSPQRERCIIDEERFRALLGQSWNSYDFDALRPDDMAHESFRRSVPAATERILKSYEAECDRLSTALQEACMNGLAKAAKEAPDAILRELEKKRKPREWMTSGPLKDRLEACDRQPAADRQKCIRSLGRETALQMIRESAIQQGSDPESIGALLELFEQMPEDRIDTLTRVDVERALAEIKARRTREQQAAGR